MNTPLVSASERLSVSRARLHWALSNTSHATGQDTWDAGFSVAKAVITPIAQIHPWRLVLGAFCVGGAVALARPWRWDSTSDILRTLIQNKLGAPAHRRHRR